MDHTPHHDNPTADDPTADDPASGTASGTSTPSRRAALIGAGLGATLTTAGLSAARLSSAAAAPLAVAVARDGGPLSITSGRFGTTSAGEPVEQFTFGNAALRVTMLTLGANIHKLVVPDRRGQLADVVLGVPTVADYEALTTYFGFTIGRYANRIARGTFVLDGKRYHIPINNGVNALHGGPKGFNTKVWNAAAIRGTAEVGVRFTYISPAGQMGFPGRLSTRVDYTVNRNGRLTIHYLATTDAPTVINLTNHSYFNLLGEGRGDVYDHSVVIEADRYTPIDATSIPLGPQAAVAGTPFDFRTPHTIGARIRNATQQIINATGYDHNWVLRGKSGAGLRLAATAHEPTTGRSLRCYTDQPGVQFYTSNFLNGTNVGVSGHAYREGDGFTLETQHFPDSPNHPHYPSTVLRPGQTYDTQTAFQFTA